MLRNDTLRLSALILVLTSSLAAQTAATRAFHFTPNATIPPSGSGGACGTTSSTFTVPMPISAVGLVSRVSVTLGIDHTYVGDLDISLQHDGVTVPLCSGTNASNPTLQLHGQYTFADAAGAAFVLASSAGSPPTIVPGTYRPTQFLSAFNGTSAGGVWSLTVCDQASADVGVLHDVTITVGLAGPTIIDPAPPSAIPPTGTGGTCGLPSTTFTRTIGVPASGHVAEVRVRLNMGHSWASDLVITLSHDGVSRLLFNGPGSGLSDQDLSGNYTFADTDGVSIATGVVNGVVQQGTYLPSASFVPFRGREAAGTWQLTVCDRASSDVGYLSAFELDLVMEGFTMAIQQPAGAASVSTRDQNGAQAGDTYFNALTLTAGSYPYGWFHGIDIGFDELTFQLNLPIPFFNGTLDGSVTAVGTIPGPIPGGIHVYAVGIDFRAGAAAQTSVPVSYVTAP